MKITGISGYVNSGKTTFAEMLTDCIGENVWHDSFAEPMHYIADFLRIPQGRKAKEKECTRYYGDFADELQDKIEHFLGYMEDNDKAQLYALFLDRLEGIGHLEYADHDKGEEVDKLTISPRSFLQILGTAGRDIRPEFWVDAFKARNAGRTGYCIVSDVRMPNEADICDKLIWLDRRGTGPVNKAASEQHYEELRKRSNLTYYNDWDLPTMRQDAGRLAGDIIRG